MFVSVSFHVSGESDCLLFPSIDPKLNELVDKPTRVDVGCRM